MSKAARTRAKRRTAALAIATAHGAPHSRTTLSARRQWGTGDRKRLVWIGTGAAVVVLAVVVAIVLATGSSSPSSPSASATPSTEDLHAPATLVAAAKAVGFHPTTEPGIGQVETQPATAVQPGSNQNLLAVGTAAPGFTLKSPQGTSFSLSQYRGKAVLIEFFTTWCPHCNAEAPYLRALSESPSLPKSTYAFLSVNADGETAPSVYAYHRYFGLEYPSLLDPSSKPGTFSSPGAPGPVSTSYKVESFPTIYIIDPKGRVFWRSDGEQPDALLVQQLHLAARHI